MLPENTILISIQPRFAAKIFERSKAVELRRVCPKVTQGDVALVYVSSPVKALYGAFLIERVVTSSPAKLWNDVKHIAGVTRAEFDRYYEGATSGVGIFIDLASLKVLNNPLDLTKLRSHWPAFQPPQSYRYLRSILDEYEHCPQRVKELIRSMVTEESSMHKEASPAGCIRAHRYASKVRVSGPHGRNRFSTTSLSGCDHAA